MSHEPAAGEGRLTGEGIQIGTTGSIYGSLPGGLSNVHFVGAPQDFTSNAVLAIDMQKRRTKGFPLTNAEMLGLSILNPVTGGLVGWGLQMWISWGEMSEGADKKIMGIGAFLLLSGGIVLQCFGWWVMLSAKKECETGHRGGVLVWIADRAIDALFDRVEKILNRWRTLRQTNRNSVNNPPSESP